MNCRNVCMCIQTTSEITFLDKKCWFGLEITNVLTFSSLLIILSNKVNVFSFLFGGLSVCLKDARAKE